MEAEMFVRHESIRAEIYKLLADCYHPPDEELPGKIMILDEKMELICHRARQDIDWNDAESLKTNQTEVLKVEYARLFVGPYTVPVPPYGSVYLETERRMMGDSTMDVVRRYREAGLEMARDFKEAPDHIAVELEFMHFLISRTLEAFTRNEPNAIRAYFEQQQYFLEYHLCAWVPEFAKNIGKHSQFRLYQYLSKVTNLFLDDDYKFIAAAMRLENDRSQKPIEINSLRV